MKKLKHLILWCPVYDEERRKDINFQRPYKGIVELLCALLFENGLKYSTKQTLYSFWKIREKKKERKANLGKKIGKNWRQEEGRK